MPYYIVRVELHAATAEQYDTLHELMQKAGYSRTIKGSDNATYHLPTAEYQAFVEDARAPAALQVRDHVKNSIEARLANSFSLLVSRADSLGWFLNKV